MRDLLKEHSAWKNHMSGSVVQNVGSLTATWATRTGGGIGGVTCGGQGGGHCLLDLDLEGFLDLLLEGVRHDVEQQQSERSDDEGGAGLQHTTNNNNKADGRRWSWAQHTTNNNNKDG